MSNEILPRLTTYAIVKETGENEKKAVSFSTDFFNPLTPELNPSAQRCLMSYFTGDFASMNRAFL
jgi:hypothetical protein